MTTVAPHRSHEERLRMQTGIAVGLPVTRAVAAMDRLAKADLLDERDRASLLEVAELLIRAVSEAEWKWNLGDSPPDFSRRVVLCLQFFDQTGVEETINQACLAIGYLMVAKESRISPERAKATADFLRRLAAFAQSY